jgi:cysteinyl-tRNA synthetase
LQGRGVVAEGVGHGAASSNGIAVRSSEVSDLYINEQIAARITAKQAKNYAEADRIRKELLAAGIVLEDNATGTTWRRA